ncbi:MAG: glycosyltransferase family 2 protein [Solirubrobacterales bacterium]
MLSVITPARNMARFLPDTLDSVAALRTPHEHIVIDGASDDGTVELLEQRHDPDLNWVSEPDSGQTEAVNKGLRRARGELVAWVNADDAYVPEVVDRELRRFERDPGLGAIFGAVNYVDESGEAFRTLVPPRFNWRRYLYFGSFVTTPTIIFRRELLSQAPSLDESYMDAADYDFYLRLLRGARVERIDEPMLNFRYHPESKTKTDVWVQLDEAREIRLGWARNPLQAGVMRAWESSRRAILPRISSWPHPEPRGAVKLLRRLGARG